MEGVGDVFVGNGVVEVYAQGSLDGGKIKVVLEILGRGGVFIRVADTEYSSVETISLERIVILIDTATTILIVG